MIIMKRFLLYLLVSLILTACANATANRSCHNLSKGYYCVQAGDTLYRISKRFKTSVNTLKRWNNLPNDRILIGQILTVAPPNNQTSTAKNAPNHRPFILPVRGHILHPYSAKNRGMDFAAPPGAPVYAVTDGTVIYTGDTIPGYGKMVLIRHNPQLLTVYANNATLLVSEHTRVRVGQVIATVGNSGRMNNIPSLHFEVRINSKAVNPQPYLPIK